MRSMVIRRVVVVKSFTIVHLGMLRGRPKMAMFTMKLIITLSCAIQLACDIEQVADGVGHLDFGRGPTFNLFRS